MKKLITFLLLFIFSVVPVSATSTDGSAAMLMLTHCTVSEGGLVAGETAYVYITLQNMSTTAAATACKLTFAEDSGDILPVGTGTQYVDAIAPGESYIWTLPVAVSANAADGNHIAHVSVSFTQADGSPGMAEDVLRLTVHQSARLEIGSRNIPSAITAGETGNLGFSVLNTGKSVLYGVTMHVSAEGIGSLGKDALGDIAAGQAASGTVSFPTAGLAAGTYNAAVRFDGETLNGTPVSVGTYFTFRISTTQEAESEADRSQPRLSVTSYSIEGDSLLPGEQKKLTVKIVNNHPEKAVRNIMLRFAAADGEITCEGVGSQYLTALDAGESYVWTLSLQAAHTAASGVHNASVSMEYEDENGGSYQASDPLRLAVRQRVQLVWDSLLFPPTVVIGDTVSLSLTLQNMGGAALQNVLLTFDTEGLGGAGSVLVGTIQAGESSGVSANFNVTAATPGDIKGTVHLQYEDDYGDLHTEDIPFSAQAIEQPQEPDAETEKKQQQESRGMRLWWLFLTGGLAIGVGGGAGVVYSVFSRKNRLQDEERL